MLVQSQHWLEAALIAIKSVLAVIPAGGRVLRGTFAGVTAQVEMQLDSVATLTQVVESLECGLVHKEHEPERGPCTGMLWRRHEWAGWVIDTPVLLWAYEILPEPTEPADTTATQSLTSRLIGWIPGLDRTRAIPVTAELNGVLAGHRADVDPVRIL